MAKPLDASSIVNRSTEASCPNNKSPACIPCDAPCSVTECSSFVMTSRKVIPVPGLQVNTSKNVNGAVKTDSR
jgi:hypothetical protein